MALDPSEELGGLPCEHRTDNQLNVTLEFGQGVMLGAMRAAIVDMLIMGLLWWGSCCA